MILLLITYLSLLDLQIKSLVTIVLMDLLAAVTLLQAMSMVRYGPRLRFVAEKIEEVGSGALVR